jgi:hypothetical protein
LKNLGFIPFIPVKYVFLVVLDERSTLKRQGKKNKGASDNGSPSSVQVVWMALG